MYASNATYSRDERFLNFFTPVTRYINYKYISSPNYPEN